jgi:capsular polysaccharide transport system permease protein
LSLSALQDARNEARRQRAYVERVAQPSLPDSALEPRRFRGIIATLIIGLVAWGVLSMLLAGVREHQD